jgi:uncharacterized protein (DUF58 family)
MYPSPDSHPSDVDHRELLRTVRRIEIATRQTVNAELAGHYHSVFKGQGMAFAEVRPYAPGDDIRHIDWNVSARQNDLFVKQFVEERELTVMLLVDISGSTQFGTRLREKRRLLAEIGALIAFSAIKNNDRVGLLLFSDQVELYVPPRKGKQHVLRIMRDLIEAKPRNPGTSLREALAFLSRVHKRRSVCFLLSDFLDPDPQWEKAMRVGLRKHDIIACRVIDPFEQELPDLGVVELVDAETGRSRFVDSHSEKVRRHYRAIRHRHAEQSRQRLRQCGADLIELHTDQDFVGPLVGFFRTRWRRLGVRA